MNTYRFIRFVKEPTQRRTGIEDVVKVFFDIDDRPQNYFSIEEFQDFLIRAGHMEENSELHRDLKTKLQTYGIHFVIDTKKGVVVDTSLEEAPVEQPSMKAIMTDMLQDNINVTLRARSRRSMTDIHRSIHQLGNLTKSISINRR